MLPLFVEARTIMVCSPKREIYKVWCLRCLAVSASPLPCSHLLMRVGMDQGSRNHFDNAAVDLGGDGNVT